MSDTSPASLVPLNLALQGGGSHGAFTWGVLDALLEDGGFIFPGISGTSAGAMNAVALAQGFASAARDIAPTAQESPEQSQRRHALGCQRARQNLRRLWENFGALGFFTFGVPLSANPWLEMLGQFFSPYQANPLDFNPLRVILRSTVDFDVLRQHCASPGVPRVFVCATNVRTGKGEIFSGERLSADAIMASACLPQLYQAVQIDGEYYWDGGFSGNPALNPLIYRTTCPDILLVQISPVQTQDVPLTANDIMERSNEITFNASLLRELRSIDFVHRLLKKGHIDPQHYRNILMHRIDGGTTLAQFGAASRSRFDPAFLLRLCELGREQARRWLSAHREHIGLYPTLEFSHRPFENPAE